MAGSKTPLQLTLAGGIGGFVECLAVQPFDLIKTRFQINQEKNPSVFNALKSIYNEGGILRFYRGILPELIGIIPKSSAMYSSYELARRFFRDLNGGVCDIKVALAAGLFSGFPEAFTVQPFQVVKVRLQAKEHLGRYKNTWDCTKKILQMEGPRGFLIGIGPTCWRNSIWNGVYFSLTHKIKEISIKKQVEGSTHSSMWPLFVSLFSGSIAGVVATCFNVPFDVVKSRFQSELRLQNVPSKYASTLPTLFAVIHAEGFAGIYKGLAPKLWRMAVGGGVAMFAFDAVCELL